MKLSTTDVAHILLALAALLVAAHLVGGLFASMRQPRVIGEIVGGILLGPTVLGALAPDVAAWLFPTDGRHAGDPERRLAAGAAAAAVLRRRGDPVGVQPRRGPAGRVDHDHGHVPAVPGRPRLPGADPRAGLLGTVGDDRCRSSWCSRRRSRSRASP